MISVLATMAFLHTILLLLLSGPCLWPGTMFFLSDPSDDAVLAQPHCLAQHGEVLLAGHAAP